MKQLQDVANLILVRNFLNSSIDNIGIKLSREQIKGIQNRVAEFDQKIIEHSLQLNLDLIGKETKVEVRQFVRESTEDTEAVMQKFTTAELTGVLPSGAKLYTETPAPPSKEVMESLVNNKGVSIPVQEVVGHNKPAKAKATKSTFKRTESE